MVLLVSRSSTSRVCSMKTNSLRYLVTAKINMWNHFALMLLILTCLQSLVTNELILNLNRSGLPLVNDERDKYATFRPLRWMCQPSLSLHTPYCVLILPAGMHCLICREKFSIKRIVDIVTNHCMYKHMFEHPHTGARWFV